MVTPKQVEDACEKMKPPIKNASPDMSGINGAFAKQGRMDGKEFDPEHLIDATAERMGEIK